MSNFDQNNQQINNQINIANVANLNCTLWIDVRGEERFFVKLDGKKTKKKTSEGFLGLFEMFIDYAKESTLTEEPDFLVYVDDQLSDGLNAGERKKFAITPGKHKVEIKLNITKTRVGDLNRIEVMAVDMALKRNNKITFPVSPGENIELDYKGYVLKFKD